MHPREPSYGTQRQSWIPMDTEPPGTGGRTLRPCDTRSPAPRTARTERVARLRATFTAEGHQGMLVTSPVNVRYPCGFHGTSTLLVTATDVSLTTDFRYVEVARALLASDPDRFHLAADRTIAGQLQVHREYVAAGDRILIEGDHVTLNRADTLRAGFPDVELMASARVIEEHRLVKDDAELARIRRAAGIADEAFRTTLADVTPGETTERELARALAARTIELGGDGEAFTTMVAAGPTGGSPHSTPSHRVIDAHQPVIIDFGAELDGYRSDMTRTIWFGALRDDAAEVYELVRRAQEQGVAAAKAGVSHAAVDATCREVIAGGGHGEHFTHPTGHNIGLDVHELPYLTAQSGDELRSNQVITVEPGVYLPGRFGVRIEDLGIVSDGAFEVLSHTPKLTPPAGLDA